MAFLNPLLLFGGLAIAAPIIIHMLMRRNVVMVKWAAMRFLRESVQRTKKRLRIEDLLLLLLRCLLILLLALALARPALRGPSAGVPGAGGAETAVMLIDNSYSMATTDGSRTRLEKAQAAAEDVINSLAPESRLALYFVSNIVDPAIAEPSADLNLARKLVREAVVHDRGTDFAPAIRQALETLKRAAGDRAIYFISDNQASGWSGIESAAQALRESPDIRFVPVIVGDAERQNTAVTAIRQSSALAPVATPVQFDVEITNFGDGDAQNVAVNLAVDDAAPGDEATIDSIPSGGAKSVSLFGRFDEAGSHTITASTTPDRLPDDDRASIAIRAIKEAPLLVVNGEPGVESRENETFFLGNALVPVAQSARESYFLKPEVAEASALTPNTFAAYDTVILANVTDVSEATAQALKTYVDRGGGVIIFLGDRVNARFYNDVLATKLALLPATLGQIVEDPAGAQLAASPYEHPILSLWNDPASGTLTSSRIYKRYDLKPAEKEAVVVAAFEKGNKAPAIIEKRSGAGRVILVATSADTEWTDIPVRPAFVPLLHRMLGSLISLKSSDLNIAVGSELSLAVAPDLLDRDMEITPPPPGQASSRRIALFDGQPALRFDQTERAGAYVARSKSDAPVTIRFAAQADRTESNLRSIDAQTFASVAGEAAAGAAQNVSFNEQARKARTGSEFWFLLLFVALILAACESILADRFSRAK